MEYNLELALSFHMTGQSFHQPCYWEKDDEELCNRKQYHPHLFQVSSFNLHSLIISLNPLIQTPKLKKKKKKTKTVAKREKGTYRRKVVDNGITGLCNGDGNCKLHPCNAGINRSCAQSQDRCKKKKG
jgi:hypothetical protein